MHLIKWSVVFSREAVLEYFNLFKITIFRFLLAFSFVFALVGILYSLFYYYWLYLLPFSLISSLATND